MKIFHLLWLIILPLNIYASSVTINGSVVDAVTDKPLTGVKVFINRTSNFGLADAAGSFILTDDFEGEAELVVCNNGYHTMVYRLTSAKPLINLKFKMVLLEVPQAINTLQNTEQQLLFTRLFIGKSLNAEQTHILNPEVLHYSYNDTSGVFSVSADTMLNIINDALGYFVNYKLESFVYNTKNGLYEILGYCFFKELTSQKPFINQKWIERRLIAYDGSFLHFSRSLYSNQLVPEGFNVKTFSRVLANQNNYKEANKSKNNFRSGTLNSNGKMVEFVDVAGNEVLPDKSYRTTNAGMGVSFFYSKPLLVDFKSTNQYLNSITNIEKRDRKSLLYLSQNIEIQQNGVYFEKDQLYIEGPMREQMAELLPVNYQP